MKKEITAAILINGYVTYESVRYFANRLKSEFNNYGISNIDTIYSNEKFIFTDDNGSIKCSLKPYDFIIFLDKDKYISELLEKFGYRLFNNSRSIEICDDKMLTYVALSNNDILMPKTISSALCYSKNPNYENFLLNVMSEIDFPMIVKENFGSLGNQVYLANNKDELFNLEKELIYKPHVYQRFIAESAGRDTRIIVVGGKFIGAMERSNPNSFKSNVAGGGNGKKIEVNENLKNVSEKVAKILGLDYCGIDFVTDKDGKNYLIEVNSNAFFNEFEKVTNTNVAKIYVEHILKEIKYE